MKLGVAPLQGTRRRDSLQLPASGGYMRDWTGISFLDNELRSRMNGANIMCNNEYMEHVASCERHST